MIRRRPAPRTNDIDVRAALRARFVEVVESWRPLGRTHPFEHLIAAIDRGEPVTVYTCELPHEVCPRKPTGRTTVHPDGRLEYVE